MRLGPLLRRVALLLKISRPERVNRLNVVRLESVICGGIGGFERGLSFGKHKDCCVILARIIIVQDIDSDF